MGFAFKCRPADYSLTDDDPYRQGFPLAVVGSVNRTALGNTVFPRVFLLVAFISKQETAFLTLHQHYPALCTRNCDPTVQ